MERKFLKIGVPQYVIDQHEERVPERWVFYRPMGSKLYRIKHHPEMTKDFVDVMLDNCIARCGMFFVHMNKIEDMLDIFAAYEMYDITFSEPDPVTWN